MSDEPTPTPPLAEVRALSGIEDVPPFTHVTFAIVAWQEEQRLRPLLERVRPFFSTLAVAVQESSDGTLAIARELADIVVEDAHQGFGDASFGPKLLPQVRTPWVLKLDADEWPSDDLLTSISSATWWAERQGTGGIWIPFRSSVDGIEYEEQHAHLRLFTTNVGWPGLLHSRPPIFDGVLWQTGHIRHDRSLDEMMQDYLRYWDVGRGNRSWEDHNRLMMYWACRGTAEKRGWDYVRSFAWWPKVEAIAYQEEHPWL